MTAQQLKNSILQMAVQGKLVPQDPNDEPASVLLERIRAEKEELIKQGKIKREKNPSVIFKGADNTPYEKVGKNEPVSIADEVPFEMPDSWEWVRLKNICNVVSARRVHQSDWKSSGVPFYRAREIGKLSENGSVDNELFISEELFAEFSKSGVPQPGDLMVTAVGTLGKTYVVSKNDRFYYKDASVICFENFGQLNSEFLQLLMMSPFMVEQIKVNTSGTTVGTITIVKANEYLVPIPPLNEQLRICNKFSDLFPFLNNYGVSYDKAKQLNDTFPEQLKKSILQYAVQGKLVPQDPSDEPAEVLLERIREEKKRLIKEGKIKKDKVESVIFRRDNSHYEKLGNIERCIDDEIPFEIPDNWAWVRASTLGSFIRGAGIKRTETTPTGQPCVRYGELYTTYTYSFDKVHSYVPNGLYKNCKHFSFGDILFSLTGENKQEIGKAVAYLGDEMVAAGGDLAFWTYHGMNPLYLSNLMYSPYAISKKANLATGDIIVHISGDKLGSILIPIPPLAEQQRIVDCIQKIRNML